MDISNNATLASPELNRGLSERHIRMMALGACIGVGLFLGAGKTIQMAGPAIMLAYIIAGIIAFIIMQALGEMAVDSPISGSFSRYANNYIGPLAGYLTGWNYWLFWVIACVAEVTAVAIYMSFWFPDIPRWYWALASLLILGGVNLIAVKLFGEFEFWFALIKVIAIVALLILGTGLIVFGIGNHGQALGISNLWLHGGLMPFGLEGVLMSLQLVVFSYGGIEMIGLTAAETKNPKKVIPQAINSIFWRILLFYVGALFVIMAIFPWNQLGGEGSPFVMVFERLGIKTAAGIINFVVITAALSSCNSGLFSTSRMLFSLAQSGQAPKLLGRLSSKGIPYLALLSTMIILMGGVYLNYKIPEKVFTIITSIATFCGIWAWFFILLAQYKFRSNLTKEQIKNLGYRMWFWPFTSYLALAFLTLIVGLLGYFEETRTSLYVGFGFLIFMTLIYHFAKLAPAVNTTK